MPIKRFPPDVTAGEIRALLPPPPSADVSEILTAVASGGDRAVLDLEQRFGGLTAANATSIMPVDKSLLETALDEVGGDLRNALELAIANVRTVAEAQISDGVRVELPQGQVVDYSEIPVERAGAYIPGGRGSYPSTAAMCLTTAHVAGVKSICAVSPAREDGRVDIAVAAVCALLGIEELYAIGGAQAIAALGYGTESIEPVDVIVGPGNSWVQEAKRQLVGRVGIDGIAGPSELVIIAAAEADPEVVSLDLLAQGEHGTDSLVVLISPDPDVLDAVASRCAEIEAQMALVLAADLESAVMLGDAIAPEHMQIMAADDTAIKLAKGVTRSGCLFIGENAATAFGDYVAGSNHVLPTGGAARYAGALSVATFRRRMSCVQVPDRAVEPLARAGATIADAEGFPLHGRSMEARIK